MFTNNETIAVILDELPVSLTMFRGTHVDSWFIEQCFFSFIGYLVFKKLLPYEKSWIGMFLEAFKKCIS
jgi:hypothetical protein